VKAKNLHSRKWVVSRSQVSKKVKHTRRQRYNIRTGQMVRNAIGLHLQYYKVVVVIRAWENTQSNLWYIKALECMQKSKW
jgi:hypothetical protein